MPSSFLTGLAGAFILTTTAVAQPASKPAAPSPGLKIALQLENHFADVADSIFPSVVTVTSYLDPPLEEKKKRAAAWILKRAATQYPAYREIAITSGFVISKEGYILTCRSGLLKPDGTLCDIVSVETQDQRHTLCKVIGTEPTLNLAVLKMDVYAKNAPPMIVPVKLGNSTKVRAGSWALGCGDPRGPVRFFGVGNFTATPKRDCYQEQLTATYMQAAMKVPPAAYGGPILNARGEVVGMLCPRFAEPGKPTPLPHEGIEFALPSNTLKTLYEALIKAKSNKSPWIGIAVMSRPELIRERGSDAYAKLQKPRFGILVENVFKPSPAYQAGLRPGDFLMQIGKDVIRTPLDFQKSIYLAGIGSRVQVKYWRRGEGSVRGMTIVARPKNATTR